MERIVITWECGGEKGRNSSKSSSPPPFSSLLCFTVSLLMSKLLFLISYVWLCNFFFLGGFSYYILCTCDSRACITQRNGSMTPKRRRHVLKIIHIAPFKLGTVVVVVPHAVTIKVKIFFFLILNSSSFSFLLLRQWLRSDWINYNTSHNITE